MSTYNNPLEVLISPSDLPDSFGVIKDGLQSAFSNVFFRDFTAFRNEFDNTSHYQLTLIIQKLLKVEVPGVDGLALSLNPDYQAGDQTAIPISLEYQWKVFERIRDFDFSTFDGGIRSIFGLLLDVLGLDEEVLLIQFIDRFFGRDEDPDLDSIAGFVADFNQKVNPPTPLSVPAGTELYDAVISILEQLNTNGNSIDLVEILFTEYFDGADFEDKINELIRGLAQPITVAGFLDNIKPYVAAAIESINLALEFPRTWLQPVDANGDVIQDQSIPSRLRFNAGRAFFSTTSGFGFESLGSFDLTPSQIGNTGLIISLTGLKVDLSTDNSIPEALADGRGNAFKGIFAEEASITLPKKWFDPNQNHPDTTAQVVGRDLLIGTGGISGQIALEAIGSVPEPVLVKQLGGDGFEIGFKSFDINFNRGSVSSSNIAGYLKIPKLEDTNGNPAQIDIQGHLDGDGDFRISASEKDGFAPLRIPNVMDITIRSLAIGSEDGDFYLEIGCKVKFTNAIMSKVLGDQELEIPQLRIYSDGSFEIVGGTIPIPANLTLDLGPVLVAITGINYGSYQQEYNGTMRKYNRWGFDGAISLGPLGVEARGKGMEYYYTVDGGAFHSYFRIKAIEVDIIIPAQATPATATAIINGYLTIPQPGDSQEFTGGVKLQLPKARISGSAEMRMIPKYPAFIVDAEISLPKPIPIASTGLGIYGFRGLLGYRYVAEKEAVGLTSGEDSWYDYYTYPPRGVDISKFSSPDQTENYNNPVSVGAGATLATVGDDGTILSTRLFLLLSLPSVFILEGKASIISKRLKLDDTQEPPFFAFMAYGDNSIEVGMGADFQLPQSNGWIVDLFANVEAGFFFNNPSAWYINFGRKDAPISARMLTLFTAQTYLQLSAKGIEAGARAEFKFNKKFGPARVKAWLYVEVGGFISFERPQFGGYLAAGGGLEVKIWIIKAGVSFDALLAVEAAKPFLIYAKVRVCAKVRIGFIKVRKCATVELKWEKSKQIDDSPIAPLLADRADELVKGVHMLSGQSFNLVRLNSNIENTYTPGAPGSNFNNAIVPLDTYVDIQFTKGLLPNAVSSQIGGVNHPPEQYTDLIPPQKTVRGGKQVRQVTHRYSIENLTVKAWSNGEWVHYHPFEALTAGQATNSNFGDLKIGQWQKSSKTYNAIRLMATSPFSYTEQGQPGWFIPEQTGITPATLYCEGQTRSSGCADWLDKPWARQYPTEVPFRAKGTYITVTSGSTVDQSQVEIAGSDYSFVSSASNPHGFAQSLAFDNYKKAAVVLPDPSVRVTLKLSSQTYGVTIRWEKAIFDDGSPDPIFVEVGQVYRDVTQLEQPVIYDDPTEPISRVIIEPDSPNRNEIDTILQQIEELFEQTYKNALAEGRPIIDSEYPDDVETYLALRVQLEDLQGGSPYGPSCNKGPIRNAIRAQIYQEVDNDNIDEYRFRLYNNRGEVILSSSTRYYTKADAVAELNLAIEHITTRPDCIDIKQATNGTWYYNVIDEVDEVLARRIEYFDTLQECEQEALAMRQLVQSHSVEISELAYGVAVPSTKYFVNRYYTSDEHIYDEVLHIAGEATYSVGFFNTTRGLIQLADAEGNGRFAHRLLENGSTYYRMWAITACENGDIITLGYGSNGRYSLNRVNSGGSFVWQKAYHTGQFPFRQNLISLAGDQYAFLEDDTVVQVNGNGGVVASKTINTNLQGSQVYGITPNGSDVIAYGNLQVNGLGNISMVQFLNSNLSSLIAYTVRPTYNTTGLYNFDLSHAAKVNDNLILCGTTATQNATDGKVPFIATWDVSNPSSPGQPTAFLFINRPGDSIRMVVDEANGFIYASLFGSARKSLHKYSLNMAHVWTRNVDNDTFLYLNGVNADGVYGHGYNGTHWAFLLNDNMEACFTSEASAESLQLMSLTARTNEIQTSISNAGVSATNLQVVNSTGGDPTTEICPGYFDNSGGSTGSGTDLDCNTLIHEICWENIEDHYYNQQIPGQPAIQADYQAAVDAINRTAAPIWRPNTEYLVSFQLRDVVDNGSRTQDYHYHYGFKTAGPIGHYNEAVPAAKQGEWDGMSQYIDYQRSYPNADGDLLNAKPLFYGSDDRNNEIQLYFTHPYVYHMLQDWPDYQQLGPVSGEMKIVVKDPTEDVLLQNPPPPNVTDTEIPATVEAWDDDNDPRMPESLRALRRFAEAQEQNPDISCVITGGEMITPKSHVRNVTLNHLKPQKMYLAIVNNSYESETREVHSFTFQTSRYQNFDQQVNSFRLDDNTQAVFPLQLDSGADVTAAYSLAADSPNTAAKALESQYIHPFDRALEGALNLKALPPAVTTEFNVIRNTSGTIVGILVRNPEPFNDPKMPLSAAGDTLEVLQGSNPNPAFRVLFAKDYAQALIMPTNLNLTPGTLRLRFRYKRWNGTEYAAQTTLPPVEITVI